jgi:hypothetical protein
MPTEQAPRTRLEQRVNAQHLSLREFVTRFGDEAAEAGERVTVSERQAKRWLAGTTGGLPMPAARRVLEAWFGEPVGTLLGPPLATVEPVTPPSERELIMSTGRDSVEHAIHSAAALDPAALEQLHAEAQRAASAYFVTAPLAMLTDLVRLRDTVYEQLDRTQKPRQKAELYLIAGQVCGLLSAVSFDLGHPDVADEQARAAHTYGSVIDHPSLQAWARALQVTVTFWSQRPRRAVTIATEALETAPRGTARVRLHSVRARALAMIGARQEVGADLDAATDQLNYAGNDEFLDETVGELGFDRSRRALCAGAAYVLLGDGDRGAAEAAEALALFREVPEEIRWKAGMLGATVDLGTARALRGDLAGAEAALSQVFELAPERRTEALSRRLLHLDRMLGTQQFRGAVEARRIGDQIEDFTTGSLDPSISRPAITAGQ